MSIKSTLKKLKTKVKRAEKGGFLGSTPILLQGKTRKGFVKHLKGKAINEKGHLSLDHVKKAAGAAVSYFTTGGVATAASLYEQNNPGGLGGTFEPPPDDVEPGLVPGLDSKSLLLIAGALAVVVLVRK